jgi:biopolymer transport protein ExbD
VVNIARDGSFKVNTQMLTDEQLGQRFKDIFALNPKQAIIIRADEETVYKNMFRVLDLCYQAGLYHVSFASRSPAPAPQP